MFLDATELSVMVGRTLPSRAWPMVLLEEDWCGEGAGDTDAS